MNAKSFLAGVLLSAAILTALFFSYGRANAARGTERSAALAAETSALKAKTAQLEEQLASAERERDRLRVDAAEVHKLRGEVSTLRKANETLEKKAAQQAQAAAQPPTPPSPGAPAQQSSDTQVAQAAAALRKKISSGGQLTAEETAWLQQTKAQLDKLESSPQEFAAFQAAMIKDVIGITDPQKVERIQQTIQKVYENAVNRGLTIENRPAGDAAWVEQRHQLDRRGTTGIQRILDENERAAFDSHFLGVMGADLGTGVDKSLYPPGFLIESH